MMRYLYSVLSPEIIWIEPILDDGSGPEERFHEHLFVLARNASRAKAVALKYWRRLLAKRRYVTYCWLDDESYHCPFTGMEVRRLNEEERIRYRDFAREEMMGLL